MAPVLLIAGLPNAIISTNCNAMERKSIRRVNQQGQALGRKGEESRRRFLDATLKLIAAEPVHKLSASRIARAAAMASQNFYLYFKNIEEVLLTLSREAAADVSELADLLDRAPAHEPPSRLSRAFIDAYAAYWERHRAILNARNYLADSGNSEFLMLRQEVTMPIIRAIGNRILAAQGEAQLSRTQAIARAVIIYMAMERLAARSHVSPYRDELESADDLYHAEIAVMTMLFTPMPDPVPAEGA